MSTVARTIHVVEVELEFPAGISPGANARASNERDISFDGAGRPVLRASALLGALRAAYAREVDASVEPDRSWGDDDAAAAPLPHPKLRTYFGHAHYTLDGTSIEGASPLRASDVVLRVGNDEGETVVPTDDRFHNGVDRHTGAVRDGVVFRVRTLPPGTRGTVRLELHSDEPGAVEFLDALVGILTSGLTLGGQAARGIGATRVVGDPVRRTYDLGDWQGVTAWLDASWRDRDGSGDVDALEPQAVTPKEPQRRLVVDVTLGIPRGQDVSVGGGVGEKYDVEPKRIEGADGRTRWSIQGSSLRGLFRGWVSRLAARDGALVRDSAQRFLRDGPASGADVGWGFLPPDEEPEAECPVERLFGSLRQKGRIHFADAHSAEEANEDHMSLRTHVAIDQISGGANDGLLFSHGALCAGPRFDLRITVDRPTEQDADWLARTLVALDRGILRVGSSKSAGRLALAAAPAAAGPNAASFREVPFEGGVS